MEKATTIFWFLVTLGFIVPIYKLIADHWTEDGGIYDTTFNATAWNVTGNATSIVELSSFEIAYWKMVPILLVLAIIVAILYVIGSKRDRGMD